DENTFILKVEGDSMIGIGIYEDDFLVVRQEPTANNGDIVVAFVKSPFTGEEEATVKRFFRENDYIRLQPENPSLEPIISKEVTIVGKAVALLRKL
ncbi:MAG: S24 family peptidase, partial [Candidatus Subteraquimicrobiales bacterium]|nr:S24 family peptidase [Candidatus Subteraquimicrobiales bacterium]